LWDERNQRLSTEQQVKQQSKAPPKVDMGNVPREKWWNKSPVLEASNKSNINFDAEKTAADNLSLDNHDRAEAPEVQKFLAEYKTRDQRKKMVEDAKWIYKDLIEELQKHKKR
jgi:hypothetical protein